MKALIEFFNTRQAASIAWAIAVLIIYFDVTRRLDKSSEKINHGLENQIEMLELQYQFQQKLDSINYSERYETTKFNIIKDSIRAWTSNEQRRQFVSDRLHKSTK